MCNLHLFVRIRLWDRTHFDILSLYIYKEPILVILLSCFFFLNYIKNKILLMNIYLLLENKYKIWTNTDTTHWQSLVYTSMAHNASADVKNVALQLKKYCAIGLASHVTWHWTYVMLKRFCRLCPINLVK
jgi:hypothetical protein